MEHNPEAYRGTVFSTAPEDGVMRAQVAVYKDSTNTPTLAVVTNLELGWGELAKAWAVRKTKRSLAMAGGWFLWNAGFALLDVHFRERGLSALMTLLALASAGVVIAHLKYFDFFTVYEYRKASKKQLKAHIKEDYPDVKKVIYLD